MAMSEIQFDPMTFADLAGWHDDDHAAAFQAFLASGARLQAHARDGTGYLNTPTSTELMTEVARAQEMSHGNVTNDDARTFFETRFVPYRCVYPDAGGLLTGYYEPVLRAARAPSAEFAVPLLRRPNQLVNLVSDADRGQFGDQLTHGFQTDTGVIPCPTRQDIEQNALDTDDLAFAWLTCPVEAFFLHVEGSGQLQFDDGTMMRVTYDGKNGHPYTSVGRYLIDQGVFQERDMTFQALKAWLQANLDRARDVLWQNKSYIFFRALKDDEPNSALGVMQIPLMPLRSLAVDTAFHEIGTPVFVSAPDLQHADPDRPGFVRLMIAHDVGSAIRGPERGDIFFGSGAEAGDKAGQTVHRGSFTVLKPKGATASL